MHEANVFLEERTCFPENSANRNELVSVLLRCLEYCEGITVLATNRITFLDVAVLPRILLSIQYKDLTERQQFQKSSQKFLDKMRTRL